MLLDIYVRFGLASPFLVQIISISVKEAEWPPFGKELFTRLTEQSNCDMSIRNLVIQGVHRGMVLVVKFLKFF